MSCVPATRSSSAISTAKGPPIVRAMTPPRTASSSNTYILVWKHPLHYLPPGDEIASPTPMGDRLKDEISRSGLRVVQDQFGQPTHPTAKRKNSSNAMLQLASSPSKCRPRHSSLSPPPIKLASGSSRMSPMRWIIKTSSLTKARMKTLLRSCGPSSVRAAGTSKQPTFQGEHWDSVYRDKSMRT